MMLGFTTKNDEKLIKHDIKQYYNIKTNCFSDNKCYFGRKQESMG